MSIEGINSNQIATAQAAITPPKPEATTAPAPAKSAATTSKPYVVELTGTALAKSLKLAGQNPSQIAQKMGLDIKIVDSYLNIKVATATPAPAPPAPAATPAPEAKQAQTAPAQTATPAEEAKEPASEKATETAQGKK
jgi:hypothetical protein